MDELLERIGKMERGELQGFWVEQFGGEKPSTRGVDLLRRQVAWRLQEERHGGLTTATKRRLRDLTHPYSKDPKHTPTANPTLQSGTTLTRNWKGRIYTVQIVSDGYVYQGNLYKGLSKIAREITGTRWSGPLFFGLRKPAKKAKAAS